VPRSDLEIVEDVRAGDRDAFRLLVERYSRRVFRIGYRMTGNEDDAEEIVQEAFLRSTNHALDLLRSRTRRAEVAVEETAEPAAEALQERLAVDSEFRGRYEKALGMLSEKERAAFVLRHLEGMSIPEAGELLGMSASATKHSIFRAVQKLRRALTPFVSNAVNGV